MQFNPPALDWNITPAAAIGVQKDLRERVKTDISVPLESVRLVAGVDVSMTKDDPQLTAGIVVWDRLEDRLIETVFSQMPGTFPYIPGLLSFREIPVLLECVKQLQSEPDMWLVDGQGIAHPRRMGIAAHFGVIIDRSTIGVGKSKLIGTFEEPGIEAGAQSPLFDKEEQIGIVLRTKLRTNPLFISPGHLIDIPSSVMIVEACLRGYRLPEPTRLAHLHVNSVRLGKGGLQAQKEAQTSLL